MTLPFRPILSVGLLLFGFICLAVGLVSFKQLQISAPETLPKNTVATTPTLAQSSITPTVTLPELEVEVVAGASGSARIVLTTDQTIKATGLSLRLVADRQLPGPSAPYTLDPKLTAAGWVSPVNTLTLENQQSFFDLAITVLQPGGAVLTPRQVLATLPVKASQVRLDSSLSRLVDNQNMTYQLVSTQP